MADPIEQKSDPGSENVEPTEIERKALEDSGALLRFAAEYVNKFPENYSLTFARARLAANSKKWTPEISKDFWDAFAKLCDLIQPVNMDCLLTAKAEVPTRRWWGLREGGDPVTLAVRTSSRYLAWLFFLLFVLIAIQLYVWLCTSLSKRVDELVTGSLALSARLGEVNFVTLQSTPDANGVSLSKFRADIESLRVEVERINLEVSFLDKVTSVVVLPRSLIELKAADSKPGTNLTEQPQTPEQELREMSARLSKARLLASGVQEKANLLVGTLASFILPLLFGTVGALAYVVRTISDQIKRSTFAQSSPIRHFMRVGLGALAGVVIGLFNTGLSNQANLSPLALAFLAGYGVEAVFSLFDALVDKFKQVPPAQIEAKK